jgi:hypothetical protein
MQHVHRLTIANVDNTQLMCSMVGGHLLGHRQETPRHCNTSPDDEYFIASALSRLFRIGTMAGNRISVTWKHWMCELPCHSRANVGQRSAAKRHDLSASATRISGLF